MVMAWVLFLCAATCLVTLCPWSFYNLSAGTPNTFCVSKRKVILAIILVISNVHLWNATHNLLHNIYQVRKWLFKAGNTVDAVLTFKIIAIYYVWLILVRSRDLHQDIVTVGVAGLSQRNATSTAINKLTVRPSADQLFLVAQKNHGMYKGLQKCHWHHCFWI